MMFLLQYFIVQGRSYVGSLHSLKIYELEPWSIAAILSIRPAFFHLLFWRFFSESLSNISYRLSLPFQLISSLVLRLSSCCHFDTPLKSSFHDHSIPTHFNPELLTSSQIYREKKHNRTWHAAGTSEKNDQNFRLRYAFKFFFFNI